MIVKREDDLRGYKIADDGKTATITAFNDYESTDIYIPSHVNGVPVTKIAFSAFKACDNIRFVRIPDTVRFIEHSAFRSCPSLEKVVCSKNTETIAAYAFANCKNLKSITVPSDLRSLILKTFDKSFKLTEFIVWDKNKGGDESRRFVVASINENRRFGFMQACLMYFDDYSMEKYDEGYAVIQEFEDLFNIAEYRLFNPDQLTDYRRRVYENAIYMSIPKLIREDQVGRLTSAGELGIIKENKISEYLELASSIGGSCMPYLLEFKEKNFSKHTLQFDL